MSTVSPDKPTSHDTQVAPRKKTPEKTAKGPTKKEVATNTVAQEVFSVPDAPPAPAPHKITINPKFMSEEYVEKFKKHTETIETTRKKLQEIDAKISKTQLDIALEDHAAAKELRSSQENAKEKESQTTHTTAHNQKLPTQIAKTEEETSSETTLTQKSPPKGPHDPKVALAADLEKGQAQASETTKKRQRENKELSEHKNATLDDHKKTDAIAQPSKRPCTGQKGTSHSS